MPRVGNNYVFNNASKLSYVSGATASMKGVAFKTILLLAITIIIGLISMMMIKVDEVIALGTVKLGYFLSPLITFVLSIESLYSFF